MQNNGVTVIASIQLKNKDIASTKNKDWQNSPVAPGLRPTGTNARIAIKVAPNRGQIVRCTESSAAFSRGLPDLISIKNISDTTMALSTSIPNARTNAPSDIS